MKMDNLWAPWRVKYLKKKSSKACLLCKFAKNKKDDRKNYVIMRSNLSFALLNIYPYNNGHLMISAIRHVKDLEALTPEEIIDIFNILKKAKLRLDKILKPHGYNIGINVGRVAGAGIAGHLHIHLVPRWRGDTNFMPVASGIKVIPQSLKELHKQLCQK